MHCVIMLHYKEGVSYFLASYRARTMEHQYLFACFFRYLFLLYSVHCFLTKQSFIIGSVTSLRTLMSVCSFVDRSVVILREITLPSHLSEHLKNKDKATQGRKKYHHDKLLVKADFNCLKHLYHF